MILLTLISSLWLGVRITITGAIIPSLVVTVDHTEHISTSLSVGGFPTSKVGPPLPWSIRSPAIG